MQSQVQGEPRRAERYLQQHLACVPDSLGRHGVALRLQRAAGQVAEAGLLDLARLAAKPEVARHFNPFLSVASVEQLRRGAIVWLEVRLFHGFLIFFLQLLNTNPAVLLHGGARLPPWLQLCVLEDRLGRLAQLVSAEEESAALPELLQVCALSVGFAHLFN